MYIYKYYVSKLKKENMFDLLITYINFIILSIKFIISFLFFHQQNLKGVRIKDKKEENNENNNINNNIEILF